jgi:hypothetical protein
MKQSKQKEFFNLTATYCVVKIWHFRWLKDNTYRLWIGAFEMELFYF